MPDQDRPIEPLHRLDPSEPDDQEVGRLERLDPDADEAAGTGPAGTMKRPPSRSASGVRGGVSAAVTLAVLLSISSIAAIGGLVAVSMRTVAPPGGPAVAPVDAEIPVATIRVGESAQGPEKQDEKRPQTQSEGEPDVALVAPAPAPAPPTPPDDDEGRAKTDTEERPSGPKSVGGAWCDAPQGGSCDAVAGGTVLQPVSQGQGDGRVAIAEDDVEEKDPGSGGHPGSGKHGG